jgi:hypothetical protein
MKQSIPSDTQREIILAELATLSAIERGTLTEEYREGSAAGEAKGAVRQGPYFKHQCWENGRNRSRRVAPEEVALLRTDLENGKRFDRLVRDLASLAIINARERRASGSGEEAEAGAKKNSTKKTSGK